MLLCSPWLPSRQLKPPWLFSSDLSRQQCDSTIQCPEWLYRSLLKMSSWLVMYVTKQYQYRAAIWIPKDGLRNLLFFSSCLQSAWVSVTFRERLTVHWSGRFWAWVDINRCDRCGNTQLSWLLNQEERAGRRPRSRRLPPTVSTHHQTKLMLLESTWWTWGSWLIEHNN